jgi:NADP-reducing hydrogenase subunit HndB
MKSLEELRKIREEVKKGLEMRDGQHRGKIVVCMGTCGIAAGARDTMNAFLQSLEQAGVEDIAVTAAGCAGFCEQEPLVEVEIKGQDPVRYGHVDAAAAEKIVKEHVVGGNKVGDLVFG